MREERKATHEKLRLSRAPWWAVLAALLLLTSLSACSTMAGIGRELRVAGDTPSKTAMDAQI